MSWHYESRLIKLINHDLINELWPWYYDSLRSRQLVEPFWCLVSLIMNSLGKKNEPLFFFFSVTQVILFSPVPLAKNGFKYDCSVNWTMSRRMNHNLDWYKSWGQIGHKYLYNTWKTSIYNKEEFLIFCSSQIRSVTSELHLPKTIVLKINDELSKCRTYAQFL